MASGRDYDIVMIGDFRFPGGVGSCIAEQIRAQAAAGYRTGLIHLKGPVLKYPHPFNPGIRRCLDDGLAVLLEPERPVSAGLVLAYHPQVFTHPPSGPLRIDAEHKLLVVNHPAVDGWGAPFYDWRAISRHIDEALDAEVPWAPVGPLARAGFRGIENAPPLWSDDWTEVLDLAVWQAPERRPGRFPVIGRHSRPDPLKWPDDPQTVLAVYPDDPAFGVHVLGGGPFLRDLVGAYPANWEVLGFNAQAPRDFLAGLDFFVYFHHSRWVEAFGRNILEAMASGALAVLPPHFQPVFGDGAVYAEPDRVREVVDRHAGCGPAFRRRVRRAQEVVGEHFGHAAHVRRLRGLIGRPRRVTVAGRKAAAKAVATASVPRPRRVLFVTSNGIGMGHLTRLLAVARRCRAPLEPVFITMSQAMRVVGEQGFLAEYLPHHGYLGCDNRAWNHHLRHDLGERIAFYGPKVVVFDGNVPYGGLVAALGDHPECLSVWCRRAMWRAGAAAEGNIERETVFDAVLEPGEFAVSYDQGLTTRHRERTRAVAPVRLLDVAEILPRAAARRALGLDPARPAALLQMGSGNNFPIDDVRGRILERLTGIGGLQVAVAEWLIADEPAELPAEVLRLQRFPLGRFLKAFDFVVSAAGYNSFHELLAVRMPTVFVPNENPTMDDQLGRAQYAARRGLALALRAHEVYKLETTLDLILDEDVRMGLSRRCAALPVENGAEEAARFIEELAMGLRADAPPAALRAALPEI